MRLFFQTSETGCLNRSVETNTDNSLPQMRSLIVSCRRFFESPTSQHLTGRVITAFPHEPQRPPPAKRRFEFVGGNSSKFWEVRVQGSDVYTSYGRIGSAGQTSCKMLESAAAATAHAAKLVQEKTRKGYVAVA